MYQKLHGVDCRNFVEHTLGWLLCSWSGGKIVQLLSDCLLPSVQLDFSGDHFLSQPDISFYSHLSSWYVNLLSTLSHLAPSGQVCIVPSLVLLGLFFQLCTLVVCSSIPHAFWILALPMTLSACGLPRGFYHWRHGVSGFSSVHGHSFAIANWFLKSSFFIIIIIPITLHYI